MPSAARRAVRPAALALGAALALLPAWAPLAAQGARGAQPAAGAASASGAGPGAGAASAAIDRAARAFQQARSVRATFEQTLANPITGTEARATGELLLAQPNRLSVRFTQPAGDRVVADGQWLWVYLPSSAPNQVVKLPGRGRGVAGVDMVGDLLTSPRARYQVADGGAATLDGRATRAVVLTPRADGTPIRQARVWVDDADAAVRQLEVTDANGLVRTLRMTSWVPNARLPRGAFTFAVPAGARVVDQAALAGGAR